MITKTKDLSLAAVLTALAVVLSFFFSLPVGIAKIMPGQHMINVIAGVLLGPVYATAIAAASALIRNLLGTGTPLAFPGGMIGALLAGLAYRYLRSTTAAAAGELIGTGILGALVSAWLVAPLVMHKTMAVLTLVVSFSLSSLVGAVLGVAALRVLKKAGIRSS
jgi:energy-coupling factor transport system ATP-binding protein